ncbi:MAG: hypothetical protein WD468_08280 [Pirellulales bacterium]
MASQFSLEKRLEALEREVAQIKLRLASPQSNGNWVDEIAGSMKPFPEFDEVVRLGREFRESTKIQAAQD